MILRLLIFVQSEEEIWIYLDITSILSGSGSYK